MHSVLNVWTGMTITEYLDITYKYFIYNRFVLPKKFIFLLSCNAHIMHRVADEIKRLGLQNIKKVLMECVASLMLCRTKTKMDELFDLIVTIFLSKSEHTAEVNLLKLKEFINEEKNDIEKIGDETKNSEIKEPDFDEYCFESMFKTQTIYKSFLYHQYYCKQFDRIKELLDSHVRDLSEKISSLNSPEFINYLFKSCIAYLPLWTAIMMPLIDPNISRVTNAYVESHMRAYKEEILLKRKDVSVGNVVRALDNYNKCLIAKEEVYQICKPNDECAKYPLHKKPV